jgi:hypothetical protein
MPLRTVPILLLLILVSACQVTEKPFILSQVDFMSNVPAPPDSVVRLSCDLDDAVLHGIEIPTASQVPGGYFKFSFRIRNNSDRLQRFFYKPFYQNETYKFNEDHVYAAENFYGSWEDASIGFKPTKSLAPGEELTITDSFRIVGNPRDERKFYGSDRATHQVNQALINNTIGYIRQDAQWMKQISEKALANKVSVDEQLYTDALWSLSDREQHDTVHNNRWKRNPRVGMYEFMLVVSGQEDYSTFPDAFKQISQPLASGEYLNPFTYVRKRGVNALLHSKVVRPRKKLLVNARLDLAKGVYVNPLSVDKPDFTREFFNGFCSDSADRYSKAQIELFFHNINRDYVLHNVKEVRDVVGENLTREEYKRMVTQYKGDNLIDTYVNSTDCPCRNISVNSVDSSIELRNPGNREGEFKKEHVGIISRIGFTYGKFRAKIQFPQILSADHVWNGITNAFWLMAQDVNAKWNMRRPCESNIGYIPKQEADNEESLYRSKREITYSEIDFEILKESEFWPKSSYQISNVPYQQDNCADNQDIMVTCTNWDMACHQPEFYNIGAVAHKIEGMKYIHHRWNQWYKALTTKVRADHDKLFKRYYYYEIEWSPEKITWRIGPEKNQLRTICVMDKNVSAIPNNQMLMIITQEWHNQEWWPTAPYKQNFIPFPKNDIIGKVLELEIE